ncbi:MAG: OmpW family outer membrane protein [Pseudomonadota bacterium]
MSNILKYSAAVAVAGSMALTTTAALAGDYMGNFMIRAGVSVIDPDSSADVFAPGGALIPGANAEVSTEVVPTATISYFFTENIAAELLCCFAQHGVEGRGALAGVNLGDTWIFPPAVTLQYHFTNFEGFKPYVGVGAQYISFFDEGNAPGLGGVSLNIDDSIGVTLQAGVDVELQDGWYLNADVRKTFFEMDATWGNGVTADVTLDPWIFTLGVGYRFNLFN